MFIITLLIPQPKCGCKMSPGHFQPSFSVLHVQCDSIVRNNKSWEELARCQLLDKIHVQHIIKSAKINANSTVHCCSGMNMSHSSEDHTVRILPHAFSHFSRSAADTDLEHFLGHHESHYLLLAVQVLLLLDSWSHLVSRHWSVDALPLWKHPCTRNYIGPVYSEAQMNESWVNNNLNEHGPLSRCHTSTSKIVTTRKYM